MQKENKILSGKRKNFQEMSESKKGVGGPGSGANGAAIAVPDGGVALQASLWDINFEEAKERIRARRKRISNRSEAAKKLQTLIKVQSMFGGGSLQQQIDAKKSHVEVS